MEWFVALAVALGVLVALARGFTALWGWTVLAALALAAGQGLGALGGGGAYIAWAVFLFIALPLNLPPLRRRLISEPLRRRIARLLPPMSQTEREAIEAGGVWWEAELFRGNPDWRQLLAVPAPRLSAEEQAFIDGPVEQLCGMLDDWQITHELNDLPREVWEFIRRERFFGMIIPKEYGGLGFSALAHSTVVMKLSARSITAGVTVMVPNSLGPAELLLHYGTEAQKDYYLPRLARGEEIPCFALTGPTAGSDAGAIPDTGIVCKGLYQGREVLGLRLNWEKRYITLAPVATVLGLAFKAYDPDHLLGPDTELGITCALIPTDTPGVEIGRRHYPLSSAFQNGPTVGRDVFIPLDWVIGGREGLGRGWRMLMERLAEGRGVSLPAQSTGAGKLAARLTGAYARIRTQFKQPIGRFEGVEEALARIGGLTYLMDAARTLTTAALDTGHRPAVVSAIVKYQLTEAMRRVVNDAMDVHGGRGICMGPGNYLARGYQALPISITVEGANILTRSMIIFGQGAMRCHPYLLKEIAAASDSDPRAGGRAFDRVLFAHLGHVLANAARSLLYGLSGARLAPSPVSGPTAAYFRSLARHSAAFALLADAALLVLGGALKRREKLSARFADALGHLYLASALLKRWEDDGRPAEDLPLVHWGARHCLYEIQEALDGILRNFPSRVPAALLRLLLFPLGRRCRRPQDALGREIAALLLSPSPARDRLTAGLHVSEDPADPAGRIEHALGRVLAAEPIEARLRKAGEARGALQGFEAWLQDLQSRGLLEAEEAEVLREAETARRAAIMVDDFAPGPRRVAAGAGEAA